MLTLGRLASERYGITLEVSSNEAFDVEIYPLNYKVIQRTIFVNKY